ncbi:MAG: SRPBCC domain-containing protein [Pirellulaceae bacterium]|nr:SRPBCC domain-containing protein [Pirellulaceae bacterium]
MDTPIPEVRQQMLFRVPALVAYEAFTDPSVTTKFWFSHSDGPLEPEVTRTWEWRAYGCSTCVDVLEAIPAKRLLIEWGEASSRSKVEWTFEKRSNDTALVAVRNFDFKGTPEQILNEAIDSMGGFSLVLANAKALLEHNICLNLILDRMPDLTT